ncbi:inter-alpha-trypsin inhibitor heavy chain H3-like [Diadema antillarum]|uniref:inter-alpha-trypsin inhibitor heavy chain H3-like n=1 Tax=Diadema antillarum TaxID=105358 RepID=UPI003A875149
MKKMNSLAFFGALFALAALASLGSCLPPGISDADFRDDDVAIITRPFEAPKEDPDAELDDGDLLVREERGVAGFFSGYGSGDFEWESEPVIETPVLTLTPEILKISVTSYITARYSSTEFRSKLKNMNKNHSAEATFTVKIPEDAFISAFSMTIDGVVYHSEVKPKEVAQKEYNEAKARGQTAGQVKQSSSDSTKFTVSVAVSARTSVVFNVTYQQLLKRKNGLFQHRIHIQPDQEVPDVRIDVHISEPQGLKEVEAFWEMSDSEDQKKLNNLTTIATRSRYSRIVFDVRGEGALITQNGIVGEFVVKYDVQHNVKAGHLQIVNGYFVHYFSPTELPTARKSVVFVIDESGSMQGNKIRQTKEAFSTILDDVRDIDTFNVVVFENSVEAWRDNQMVPATEENIADAKRYVKRIDASGGTNFYGGLLKAVRLLDEHTGENSLPLIIMLSDGAPTSGEVTNTAEITSRITKIIDGRISVFNIGFGHGVDYNFLDKLSLNNNGLARKVYEDSDAALQMKGFYDEVANPLLFNINIEYNNNLIDKDSLTKSSFKAYYDGTEITVAGKLKDEVINAVWNKPDQPTETVENHDPATPAGNETILASAAQPAVLSLVDGNESNDLQLDVTITAMSLDVGIEFNTSVPVDEERTLSRNEVDNFAQRLWAYLSIKNILDQRKTTRNRAARDNLTERALNLSMKYHFVTPLTSLLVVKPEEDAVDEPIGGGEDVVAEDEVADVAQSLSPQAAPNVPIQSRGMFSGGVARKQRPSSPPFTSYVLRGPQAPLSSADSDPHFLIKLPETDVTVCFDINGDPGDVFSLLDDPKLGLTVTALVIPAGRMANLSENVNGQPDEPVRTYFGQMRVGLGSDRYLLLTPDFIEVSTEAFRLRWEDDLTLRVGDFVVQVRHKRHVIISHGDEVAIVIMLHRVRAHDPNDIIKAHRVTHFGFYVAERRGLSNEVHGLIGQFQQKKDVLVSIPTEVDQDGVDAMVIADSVNATLSIDKRSVNVMRKIRRVPLIRDYQDCWYAADNAKGLIEGNYADYRLPHLMSPLSRKFNV